VTRISDAPIGIVAGGGDVPARLASHLENQGQEFLIAALEGFCTPETVLNRPHFWTRLGAVGSTLSRLKRSGVQELCLIGGVKRPSFSSLRPDAKGALLIAKLGSAIFGGDDALLKAIRGVLEGEGFRIVGAVDLMKSLAIEAGTLTNLAPDAAALEDIRRGWSVAIALGESDVGQALVVQQGLVLAVEAVEGTDAMLSRVPALARDGVAGILIKLPKPGQDRSLDLPTLGPNTVSTAAKAGLRGIVCQAGVTLIVDKEATVTAANEAGIFITAFGGVPEGEGVS